MGYNVICNAKFNTNLSKRELQVLEMYAGRLMEMDAIAEELFLSPYTVDTQIRNIRLKLDIHDKAGLVKFYETKMK
jgi:DNA-binding CsgD family transcriptional regulator